MPDMTMRQRLLSVLQGRQADRVPFIQYDGIMAPNDEVWALLGRPNVGLLRWVSLHQIRAPHCRWQREQTRINGREGIRRTLHTPEGDLRDERVIEPAYGTSAARRHFVKDPADYKSLMAYLRDCQVQTDIEGYLKHYQELGEDGLPLLAVQRTPFQQLWIEWVCLEDLCLHLADLPELMEEVAALMMDLQRRVWQGVARAVREGVPIHFVDFPDNITAPVIGQRYFRRYCVPCYRELVALLAETGKDVPVYVHMDGDLKPLWPAIGESGIRGLDSLSPPPDNDTSAGDVARMWPTMRMGVNFPSSVHLRPAGEIHAAARDILQQAGHTGRLWIQISENVPPGMWRKSYPPIVQAIEDFGRP
jgi:hypothetical protein